MYPPGVSKAGVQRFGNHYYYFSWLDSDFQLSRGSWSWFNARNYCRKRCMDLVSFETPQEWDWVRGFMDGEILLNNAIPRCGTNNQNANHS